MKNTIEKRNNGEYVVYCDLDCPHLGISIESGKAMYCDKYGAILSKIWLARKRLRACARCRKDTVALHKAAVKKNRDIAE